MKQKFSFTVILGGEIGDRQEANDPHSEPQNLCICSFR